MTIQEQKNLIINAMREVFPNILPSRLQEARQAILTHVGMTMLTWVPTLVVSQSLITLQPSCEAPKVYRNDHSRLGMEMEWYCGLQAEAPVVSQPTQTTMEMMMLEDDLFGEIEVNTNAPSLYDLTCEETLIRLVATTPCFGKVVQSDPICQGCPLLAQCCETKGEAQQAKRKHEKRGMKP